MTKLTPEQVLEIRREAAENPRLSVEYFGKKYGVSISTITAIIKRMTWPDLEQTKKDRR